MAAKMMPIFNGLLTLAKLRNDFVQEYHWPYGFPPHGHQFRRVSKIPKRQAWQQITELVADQTGVVFEIVSQAAFLSEMEDGKR